MADRGRLESWGLQNSDRENDFRKGATKVILFVLYYVLERVSKFIPAISTRDAFGVSPHFTPDFTLNLVNVAHYTSQIQHKI